MLLLNIILGCLVGSILSLAMSAVLAFRLSQTWVYRLIAYAAGVMLTTALLDALPEAFEATSDHRVLFATFLAGIMGFFIMERFSLWRHSHPGDEVHDHGCPENLHHSHHTHDHGHSSSRSIIPVILFGGGLHNFVDGILIAAAFMTNFQLGVAASIAVFAHEIPHELGDFVLLLSAGWSRTQAFLGHLASSFASVIGGVIGYFALSNAQQYVPFVLTIAAASFVYIALADLLPMLHRRHRADGFGWQVLLIGLGIASVPLIEHLVH